MTGLLVCIRRAIYRYGALLALKYKCFKEEDIIINLVKANQIEKTLFYTSVQSLFLLFHTFSNSNTYLGHHPMSSSALSSMAPGKRQLSAEKSAACETQILSTCPPPAAQRLGSRNFCLFCALHALYVDGLFISINFGLGTCMWHN